MKNLLIIALLLCSTQLFAQHQKFSDSFTAFDAMGTVKVVDGTFYTAINARKAAVVTNRKDIGEAILKDCPNEIMSFRKRGSHYTFYTVANCTKVQEVLKGFTRPMIAKANPVL